MKKNVAKKKKNGKSASSLVQALAAAAIGPSAPAEAAEPIVEATVQTSESGEQPAPAVFVTVQQPQAASASKIPEEVAPGQSHSFIKNNVYFTICIYGLIMILLSAVIFKAIIDIEETKAWFTQIFSLLGPFVFGALIAYILNPMVKSFSKGIQKLCVWLNKKGAKHPKLRKLKNFRMKYGVRTGLAIFLTYLIVLGFIAITLNFVLPEITRNIVDFANYVPQAYDTFLNYLDNLQTMFPSIDIQSLSKPLTDALPDIVTAIRDMATNMVPAIYSISMSIASWIINILITIIVSVYMLYDKNRLMKAGWRVLYAFLPKKVIPTCHEIFSECNRLFSSFVVGKFIDSTIIGILCFILMAILRLKYIPLISLIVGVTNMIPYFGPFIGAIPGILILLFISPVQSLIFAILILCLQQFDGLILGPKILGDSTGMKPLWIIFAITIGGNIAGVVGMFLGVPVVAILSYLLDRYLTYRLEKKGISELHISNLVKTDTK